MKHEFITPTSYSNLAWMNFKKLQIFKGHNTSLKSLLQSIFPYFRILEYLSNVTNVD